jgi:hypothetical protein
MFRWLTETGRSHGEDLTEVVLRAADHKLLDTSLAQDTSNDAVGDGLGVREQIDGSANESAGDFMADCHQVAQAAGLPVGGLGISLLHR